MQFNMKTMKHILLIICIACATTALAIDYKLYETSAFKSTSSTNFYNGSVANSSPLLTGSPHVPTVEFHSTSIMPSTGSHLSISSHAGVSIDEGGNTQITSGPKRLPQLPTDPFLDPLADEIPCLLLLAAAYGIYLRRKTSVQPPRLR